MSFETNSQQILKNSTLSGIKPKESHTMNPFFNSPQTTTFDDKNRRKCISQKNIQFLTPLPEEIKELYHTLDDDMTEIKFNDITFMSLNEIATRASNMENIISIGTIYRVMGHVFVLSIDKKSNKFFLRCDGGSNGFEREDYYIHYKTLDTSTLDEKYFVDNLHSLIVKDLRPVAYSN